MPRLTGCIWHCWTDFVGMCVKARWAWLARYVNDPLLIGDLDDDALTELDRERGAVRQIRDVHRAHVERARSYATGLADEASFLSEEGPRETEAELGDEDSEAAVEAATARAASARALLAWKRVRELESAGDALAFGRLDRVVHGIEYVGRMSVIDGDDVFLIDWRAPAAEAFYRATPLEPMDVTHRRHLHYTDGELTNYSDEIFDTGKIENHQALRGEAALLASLAQRNDGRMQSVVATIQSEQDAVIRSSAKGPLLVQGGPGTGKTVVALHRAAYLLYADRAALAETGVLIVGPSSEFLNYISDVLPSLGESGVVSVTPDRLFPGVLTDPDESEAVAELKGGAAMAGLLATAVERRQRVPQEGLVTFYGSRRVVVSVDELRDYFALARRQSTHNAGAGRLRGLVLDRLVTELHEPGFEGRADIRNDLSVSPEVVRFCEKHWPVLTPEQMLNDLLGSPNLLRAACDAAGLDEHADALLARQRVSERELWRRRWFVSDVPLLDELLWLLGDPDEAVGVESDMEHQFADEEDVFEIDEKRGDDEDDFDDEDALDPEPGPIEVESFDAWREGDEEGSDGHR